MNGRIKYIIRNAINISNIERRIVDELLVKMDIYKQEDIGFWLRRTAGSDTPKYYVIRLNSEIGIGAALNVCLCQWNYIKSQGYTPVVWMPYNNADIFSSLTEGSDRIMNRWEYHMEAKFPLAEVINADNVYISALDMKGCNLHPPRPLKKYYRLNTNSLSCIDSSNELALYRKFSMDFFKPKQDIITRADRFAAKYNLKECLGVGMRELFMMHTYHAEQKKSEYQKFLEQRHPMMPSIEDLIKQIRDRMKEWHYNKIFLSTIYEETVSKFQDCFGEDKIIVYPRTRSSLNEFLEDADGYVERSRKKLGYEGVRHIEVEYMEEICALSKCDSIIMARSGAVKIVGMYRDQPFLNFELFPDGNRNSMY